MNLSSGLWRTKRDSIKLVSVSIKRTYCLPRLHNELRYYLSSRGVDNFEKLCNLLISDKLKSCLAPGALN